MATESKTGLGVAQHYGARDTGATVGYEQTNSSNHRLSFEITGYGLTQGSKFLPPIVVPKGAIVKSATLYVDEAFGAGVGFTIGQGNAEATNGIALAAADLAVGGRDVTTKLAGTWAAGAGITAPHRVGLITAGTPTKAGKASLVIEYTYKRRVDTEWPQNATSNPTGYTPQFQV
jgi:hypothetical protein